MFRTSAIRLSLVALISLPLAACADVGDPEEARSEHQAVETKPKGTVLVVVSAGDSLELQDGISFPSGTFISELSPAVTELRAAGYATVFATPGGRPPVIDTHGLAKALGCFPALLDCALQRHRQRDLATAKELFGGLTFSTNAVTSDITALIEPFRGEARPGVFLSMEELAHDDALARFDGLYVPGGHAPKSDLVFSQEFGTILRHFHAAKKPTALVCHAPMAIAAAFPGGWKASVDRTAEEQEAFAERRERFIYAGYQATIGSKAEERLLESHLYLAPRSKFFPAEADGIQKRLRFFVEDELRDTGVRVKQGRYIPRIPSTPYVVRDRELITGGNPASTKPAARALVRALEEQRSARARGVPTPEPVVSDEAPELER